MSKADVARLLVVLSLAALPVAGCDLVGPPTPIPSPIPIPTLTPVSTNTPAPTPSLFPSLTPAVSPVTVPSGTLAPRPPVSGSPIPTRTPTPRPTGTPTRTPTPAPTIQFSNLTPAPDSTVRGSPEVIIAANVNSNRPIGPITVYLDGQKVDVEVMGKDVNQLSFFTGRVLAPGSHQVRAIAGAQGGSSVEADWSFTILPSTTPSPTR